MNTLFGFLLQALALLNPKAVLLIHDNKAQLLILDLICEDRMCTNDDVSFA